MIASCALKSPRSRILFAVGDRLRDVVTARVELPRRVFVPRMQRVDIDLGEAHEPHLGIGATRSCCGLSGSSSCDQSIRVCAFHWRSFPFSYRASIPSRSGVISQLNSAS